MSRFAQRLQRVSITKGALLAAWPDATNTGVPQGTVMLRIPQDVTTGTGWNWDPRGWVTISGNGCVFSGFSVNANVDVTASNVLIQNCRIIGSGSGNFGISLRTVDSVTVQDCTISGQNPAGGVDLNNLQFAIKDINGNCTNTIIRRCNMFDNANSIHFTQSVLIQDNYIHNTGYDPATDHVDCMITNGGGSNITIRHNTILNEYNQTAAIALYSDFGSPKNVTVDNNLLGGGGYSLYAGGGGTTGQNIHITNNHFTARFYPNGGNFGPYTSWQPADPGNVWSGNVWEDGPKVGQSVV